MTDLQTEINLLKQRNIRVEGDKAWETSKVRRVCIVIITYILATLFMWVIGVEKPYIASFIPTLGFFLSTLSLKFVQSYWVKSIYKKDS
jgi:hypothetical protein